MHLVNEVLEHLLGDREVSDYPILQGPDRLDVSGGSTQHALGRISHRGDALDLTGATFLTDRDDRRLVEHDALAAGVDQSVGGA